MNRSPLEIISVSSEVTISFRCDGQKIEALIAAEGGMVLKEISLEHSLSLARELMSCALQMMRAEK